MTVDSRTIIETIGITALLIFVLTIWWIDSEHIDYQEQTKIKAIEPIKIPSFEYKSYKKSIQSQSFLEIHANFDFVDCDKIREDNDMVCLACNIYHEARNQPKEGQIAVANVTLNRVKSNRFPDDICSVVWQKKQFSWTWDGKSDKTYEETAWKHALELSYILIKGSEYGQQIDDNTNGALWYHADYTTPYWMHDANITAIYGDHIFYKSVSDE